MHIKILRVIIKSKEIDWFLIGKGEINMKEKYYQFDGRQENRNKVKHGK